MSSKSSTACALALTLWALPARSAERVFESWDDFYRDWARSKAQAVSTELPPQRRNGEQVSRDFEIGDQTLRLLNPTAPTLRLNGKTLRVALSWPKVTRDALDLEGASAFTYPETDLLACVHANFQGLGQSGSFQNVRQLTLVFRAATPQAKARVVRVTGYGFDCRGVLRGTDGWQLAQVVEGEADGEKVFKRWRLGEKSLTPLEQTLKLRMQDWKIVTPGEQLP
jgi:hypothetical protein